VSGFTVGLAIIGGLVLAVLVAWNAWTTRRNTPRQPDDGPRCRPPCRWKPDERPIEPTFDDEPLAPLPDAGEEAGLDG
jgi:hypothetical protein